MEKPRTFRDLMLADLRRAQNLVTKVHPAPIDPQFRIATLDGDYWIAITLTENAKERARRLALVSDFMAWKLSPGFTLASELHEPESVYVAGIMHREQHGLISLTQRLPPNRTGTYEVVFTEPRWLTREELGDDIPSLLPRGSRVITTAREKELRQWFGHDGKFPAVLLGPDGKIPR
jgi:hypothetical protein